MGDRAHLQQLRRDRAKSGDGLLVAYTDEKNSALTLSGNDDGPYVVPVTTVLLDATTDGAGETSRVLVGEYLLVEIAAYNATLGKLYLQVFDAAAVPANGAVPTFAAVPIATDETTAIDIDGAIEFEKGIVVVFSSTALTLTIALPNAGSISIFYRPDV